MNHYFEKEIKNRRALLDDLATKNDSLKINTAAIHEEIDAYIFLSKDSENRSAAVNKANAYFLNMANSYGINYADFVQLTTSMKMNEVTTFLRQNELNLLNQLLFKSHSNQIIPYTAQ